MVTNLFLSAESKQQGKNIAGCLTWAPGIITNKYLVKSTDMLPVLLTVLPMLREEWEIVSYFTKKLSKVFLTLGKLLCLGNTHLAF